MKKVFHKLRDYVLALLTLMAMSACSESLNTLGNYLILSALRNNNLALFLQLADLVNNALLGSLYIAAAHVM